MTDTDSLKAALEALRPFAEMVDDVKESASDLQCGRDDFYVTQVGGYKVGDLYTDDFVRAADAYEALRASTDAAPVAEPWGYGWYENGGKKMAYGYLPTIHYPRSEYVEEGPFPLYRHPPVPDAAGDARERVARLIAPVAWMYSPLGKLKDQKIRSYVSLTRHEFRGEPQGHWTETPLYAHPPVPDAAGEGGLPPMPETDDREGFGCLPYSTTPLPYDESDRDWADRNNEAVAWLADNHKAIRAALAQPPAAEPSSLDKHLARRLAKASSIIRRWVDQEIVMTDPDCANPILREAKRFLDDKGALPAAEPVGMREALEEAKRQLEYIDERSPSGTTPAVIARIDAALATGNGGEGRS